MGKRVQASVLLVGLNIQGLAAQMPVHRSRLAVGRVVEEALVGNVQASNRLAQLDWIRMARLRPLPAARLDLKASCPKSLPPRLVVAARQDVMQPRSGQVRGGPPWW